MILREVARDRRCSSRTLSRLHNVSQRNILNVMRNKNLNPYHWQLAQCLTPEDYVPRMQFCRLFQQHQRLRDRRHWYPSQMKDHLAWTELRISTIPILAQNQSPWYSPICRHQHQFQVNVWAGIIGDNPKFQMFHRSNWTATRIYVSFVVIAGTPRGPPLSSSSRLVVNAWWSSNPVRQYRDATYHKRWIWLGTPVAWQPRSLDLNPLDSYLWGHPKALTYKDSVQDSR